MRNLLALIIIAAAAYFGWQYYQAHPDVVAQYIPALAKPTPEPAASADGSAPPAPGVPASSPSAAGSTHMPPAPVATPPPFASKIVITDPAVTTTPPGVFLVVERASVETKTGVIAVSPGDRVNLLERKADGTVRVTDGSAEFTMRESQLTQDIPTAQAAEKAEWAKRFGGRQ